MKKLMLLSLILVLAACKTTPYKINYQAKNTQSMKIFSLIKQENIFVDVPVSDTSSSLFPLYGFAGALVGAAIDASVNGTNISSANDSIEVLRDNLKEIDMRAEISDALLELNFSESGITITEVISISHIGELASHLQAGENYMLVTSRYRMASLFKYAYLTTNVSIRSYGNGDNNKYIFKNAYTTISRMVPDRIEKTDEEVSAQVRHAKNWFNSLPEHRKHRENKNKLNKMLRKATRPVFLFEERYHAQLKQWLTPYQLDYLKLFLTEDIDKHMSLIPEDIAKVEDLITLHKTSKEKKITLLHLANSGDNSIFQVVANDWIGRICNWPETDNNRPTNMQCFH